MMIWHLYQEIPIAIYSAYGKRTRVFVFALGLLIILLRYVFRHELSGSLDISLLRFLDIESFRCIVRSTLFGYAIFDAINDVIRLCLFYHGFSFLLV